MATLGTRRIPPELHLHILDYVLGDKLIYGKRFFPIWPRLALVCRSWRVRVHQAVFQYISLTALQKDPKGIKLFDDGLADLCLSSALVSIWTPCTHNLGWCIRSLVLYLVPPTQLFTLIHQLPVLESLTLLNELPQDWNSLDLELVGIPEKYTFPSVQDLYIFQTSPEYKVDTSLFIPHLVSRFPSVAYLALELPCAPSTPRSRWPPGPKNLVAFRSHGVRGVPQSPSLAAHYILSASSDTLRVLKVWLLLPADAMQIARKHGNTLECLTVHSPPKWPSDRIMTWHGTIKYFFNLKHLSLSSMLSRRNDVMDLIPRKNLRHLELAVNNLKPLPGSVSGETIANGLKECPLLERVTIHYSRAIPEIEAFSKQNKELKYVRRQWDVLKLPNEPYPDYVIAGASFRYTSWEDVADLQDYPIVPLAPRKYMHTAPSQLGHTIIRHI